MLRFRLGDIPITVRFSHLAVCALLGTLMVRELPALEPGVWPYRPLLEQAGPEYARAALLVALLWMVIIFLCTFGHELGHAGMYRLFGHRPTVELFWLGGATRLSPMVSPPWHQRVLGTAAGPLAGLVLGMGAWALEDLPALAPFPAWRFLCGWLLRVNLFWTVFNLLPVPGLDGGTLVSALATRLFGRRGFLAAQALALLLCVPLVAFGLLHNPLVSVLFGLYGLQALRLLRSPPSEATSAASEPAPSPEALVLREAQEALATGRLDEARERAVRVLGAETSGAELTSRAHHLLGWVALKRGEGRPALEHFARIHHQPVEPHALAAAFSLVGDEAKALALWEMAWHQTRHPTILHEYAGSLIRAQRVQQALALPGVEPGAAFLCAGRPLFVRGAYSEAADISEQGLAHAPLARLAYDAACAHARARHLSDAVRLLQRAAELGFQDAHYASSDEDLASLHGHPDFERWLTQLPKSLLA